MGNRNHSFIIKKSPGKRRVREISSTTFSTSFSLFQRNCVCREGPKNWLVFMGCNNLEQQGPAELEKREMGRVKEHFSQSDGIAKIYWVWGKGSFPWRWCMQEGISLSILSSHFCPWCDVLTPAGHKFCHSPVSTKYLENIYQLFQDLRT